MKNRNGKTADGTNKAPTRGQPDQGRDADLGNGSFPNRKRFAADNGLAKHDNRADGSNFGDST